MKCCYRYDLYLFFLFFFISYVVDKFSFRLIIPQMILKGKFLVLNPFSPNIQSKNLPNDAMNEIFATVLSFELTLYCSWYLMQKVDVVDE